MKDCAQPLQHIEHGIPPVFDERSEVLVLGTMPSPKSREAAFFYGHPQNRFWRVLAALFDEPVPEDNAERADLLLRHHIALWDVLESCDIRGASDASIANPHPNDLSRVLEKAPVRRVFCTGAAAGRYYAKLCEAASGLAAEVLPSPSPANAAWSLPRLVEAYRPVADATTPFKPPVLEVSQVVALERAIAEAGTPLDALMRRAGRFLAFEACKALEGMEGAKEIVIFCGNGNNGGDGWVAGEYLDRWGIPVCLVTAVEPAALTAEPARAAALRATASLSAHSQVVLAPTDAEVPALLNGASLAIDALLGTGFAHDTVKAPFDGWIRALNAARDRGTLVVAADVPSGFSAQMGGERCRARRPHRHDDRAEAGSCRQRRCRTLRTLRGRPDCLHRAARLELARISHRRIRGDRAELLPRIAFRLTRMRVAPIRFPQVEILLSRPCALWKWAGEGAMVPRKN